MKKVAPYLFRQKFTGTFIFRRMVPKELRKTLGKTEIKKSINTTDTINALQQSTHYLKQTEALFNMAAPKIKIGPGTIEIDITPEEIQKLRE